jgi:predicted PurR-regulated permease PerM
VGLTPASAALLVGAVVTAFVLRDAFVAAHRTVGWVVASAVVALLLDPLVNRLDRVLPRWLSVIVVLLGLLALVGTITFGLATDLQDSVDELEQAAPEAARGLEERYEWAADVEVAQRVDDFIATLNDRITEGAVSEALGTAPTYLVTGILMLFLLAYGGRYFESFVAQFDDPARRYSVRTVAVEGAVRGRTYLLFALANALVNGLIVAATAELLDLPAEASLGVAVGLLTVLPLVGVLVGGIPALLLAFGLEGWRTAAVMFVVLVGLQLVEALVVRRRVDPRTVRVGPAIPIIVALVGFELYGFGGGLYALALSVIALAALDTAGRLRGDAEALA